MYARRIVTGPATAIGFAIVVLAVRSLFTSEVTVPIPPGDSPRGSYAPEAESPPAGELVFDAAETDLGSVKGPVFHLLAYPALS
jgi:hypothetical protein